MLQCLDELEEAIRFLQALYNLEGWDIAGVVYIVPPDGLVKSPTEATDLIECWGSFGCIEDWFIKRTCSDNILKYSSLYNSFNRYRRRKPLSHLYSIGNKKEDLIRFKSESAKRLKVVSRYTWNDYLQSYLAERREERLHCSYRYIKDITSILLPASVFVHTEVKLLKSRK
jgi:hypothetical protein